MFPTALLRLRVTPQSHGSSPYKSVYGRPPPIIKQVSTNLPQVRGDEISEQMEQLGKVINQVTKLVRLVGCHLWGRTESDTTEVT